MPKAGTFGASVINLNQIRRQVVRHTYIHGGNARKLHRNFKKSKQHSTVQDRNKSEANYICKRIAKQPSLQKSKLS